MVPKWKKALDRERREEFEAFLSECCITSRGGQDHGPLFDYFPNIKAAYEEFADRRGVQAPVRLTPTKLGRELTVFFRKESTWKGLRYFDLRVKA